MTSIRKDVLIIGCGIAGPVLAMLLERIGMRPVIYEAQSTPMDYAGSFQNMASNGLNVLDMVDLKDLVTDGEFLCPRMTIWNGSGKLLGEVRNGASEDQGFVSVMIKRGQLHKILREEAMRRGIPVHFGKKLKAIEVTGQQEVLATFEDNSQASGNILIGCDGIHSQTRQIIDPVAPRPIYTGMICCGGFAQSSTIPSTSDSLQLVYGKQAFFGHLVKPDGQIYWFNNILWPDEPLRGSLNNVANDEWKQMLLDLHQEDPYPIAEIIRSTESTIGRYPTYELPCVPNWHAGPLVLVGDAAHAMSPHSGQGVSMALEDAFLLTRCLQDIPALEEAFTTYQRLRSTRVNKMIKLAQRTGQSKTISSPIGLWVRDHAMQVSLKVFANSNSRSWVYAYRADWNQQIA